MREIKFRGKRLDSGGWVYGYLVCMSYRAWIKDESDKYTNPRMLANNTADVRCVEVDPATIGQFTGLHDKNGKEIYEGDVVSGGMLRCNGGYSIYNEQTTVHFESGLFKAGSISLCSVNEHAEVVGI